MQNGDEPGRVGTESELEDWQRSEIQESVQRIILALGEFTNAEVLKNTPRRVAKMYGELLSGYKMKPEEILAKAFEEGDDSLVVISGTEFYSICEHHLVPFFGKVHIAYIAQKNKVVGLSKIPRLVDCFARRIQLQERMTRQIADAFARYVSADVMVISESQHLCYMMRGIEKQGTVTRISKVLGRFLTIPAARQEAMQLMRLGDG